MRFDQIDLTRYGCFTEHSIDFGKPKPSGDFHIIYGPNEAGKSTLRAACLDFLFGIETRSKYNFLHDYKVMEIGAKVSSKGQVLDAKRIKGKNNNLLSPSNGIISDIQLQTMLSGVARDSYVQMYSLNDGSLEEGGESILGSKGDLGELLFSAMSGLSDISTSLKEAQDCADAFFKSKGRAYKLNEMKKELENIEGEIKENDVLATTYTKLKEQSEMAKQEWQKIKSEQDKNSSRLRLLSSLSSTYSNWTHYNAECDKLSDYEDAPNVPKGWDDEINDLLKSEAQTDTTLAVEREAVERCEKELSVISVDNEVLEVAPMVEQLNSDELESLYRGANKDLPSRQGELENVRSNIAQKLKQLGRADDEDASQLLLPAAIAGELTSLIERWPDVESKEKSALTEWEGAQDIHEKAKEKGSKVSDISDASALNKIVKQVRKETGADAVWVAEKEDKTAQRELDTAMSALHPWQGDVASLSTVHKPQDKLLEKLISEQQQFALDQQSFKKDHVRLEDSLTAVQSEIDALTKQASIISDEETINSLRHCEDAWREHRDSLNLKTPPSLKSLQKTADAYANAFASYDKLMTTRLTQTSEIAQLRQAYVDRGKFLTQMESLKNKEKESNAALKSHKGACSKLLESLLLPSDYLLESVSEWLLRLEQAKDKQSRSVETGESCEDIAASHQVASDKLDKAMVAHSLASEGLVWSEKLDACDDVIELWHSYSHKLEAQKDLLKDAQENEDKRHRELERSKEAKQAWQKEWDASLKATWIESTSVASVKSTLSLLTSLEADVNEKQKLQQRIDAMHADKEAYIAEVERLANKVGEAFDQKDPLKTANDLRSKVAIEQEAQRDYEKTQKALKDAEERLADTNSRKQRIVVRFEQMQESIPAESLASMQLEIQRGIKKNDVIDTVNNYGRGLVESLGKETLSDALELMNDTFSDVDALEKIKQEIDSLENNEENINAQVGEKYHEFQKADNALNTIGSDSYSAELEERKRTLLLEIEEEAHEFMQLSAGVLLANEALHTYRDTHRSSMMDAASDAFVSMTRGAFTKLSVVPKNDTELLVGIRANGSSIVASEMSKGTRFQLYLALRIAGHAEFARQGETLPFFADDILEAFDDERSKETFALLHAMSQNGQVVYLTHHKHLCDLATEVTGGAVMIHELPDRAMTGFAKKAA